MQTFFVEIKCKLGKTYDVASALADREIASEIYSIAGDYDILAKFQDAINRVDQGTKPDASWKTFLTEVDALK